LIDIPGLPCELAGLNIECRVSDPVGPAEVNPWSYVFRVLFVSCSSEERASLAAEGDVNTSYTCHYGNCCCIMSRW